MKSHPQITVSIATKDRPEDLVNTLYQLNQFGLGDVPILVLDDGSNPPISPGCLKGFTNAKLLRSTQPLGQAAGRNRIAREAETPYLLQLDDDSFPIEGSVERAITALNTSSNRIAIAIPMEEPSRNRAIPERLLGNDEIEVKSFVGCSVLLDREKFLELGGYAGWIGRTGEEEEFCIRAVRQGYQIVTSSALRVRHMATSTGRCLDGILDRSIANRLGIWIRHAPAATVINKTFRLLAFAMLADIRRHRIGTTRATVSALFNSSHWKARDPMSKDTMSRYLVLVHLLDFYPKIT